MAAQLTARNRPSVGLAAWANRWTARATSSLPVPLSPRISTVDGVGADLPDHLHRLPHRRAAADDHLAGLGVAVQLAAQPLVLAEQVALLEQPANLAEHLVRG